MSSSISLVLPEPERRIALIVGVNAAHDAQTPMLTQELNAIKDTEKMAKVLKECCGFQLLQPPLLGGKATSEHVKQALLALARDRADDDFLLFYFSGHGQPIMRGSDQADVYLVTYNFKEVEAEGDEGMHLSMRWLQDKFYLSSSAGKILLILDCCYAGDMGRTAPDPYLEELKARINDYFGSPGATSGSRRGGLRLALTATGHAQTASDKDNHGVLTGLLLEALQGYVDDVIDLNDRGYVRLQRVHQYLEKAMPETQKPSVSGDYAGKSCIFAQYKSKRKSIDKPRNYIPFARNKLFQLRPDELDGQAKLLRLLGAEQECDIAAHPRIVGLIGMGGIGKTHLAIELAYRFLEKQCFPAGIFWMPASGKNISEWQYQFAELAVNANYLPPNDDVSHPENEARRARHFCHYLCEHREALLILDNLEDPDLIKSIIPVLAGQEMVCSILYTSRIKSAPAGTTIHEVTSLPEDQSLCLLLETTRPQVWSDIVAGNRTSETEAARILCQLVHHLPLALTQLRCLLAEDQHMLVICLQEAFTQQGMLNVIDLLTTTFDKSWNLVNDANQQRLFKLACCFPEAALIPLWLLGLAANLGERRDPFSLLGKACRHLEKLSLLEVLSGEQIRLHPLHREFGRYLLKREDEQGVALLEDAGQQLVVAFANVDNLERRVQQMGYWNCLVQIRQARDYAYLLGTSHAKTLEQIGRWLDRESSQLAHNRWWPGQLSGLFYQQLYNRAVEEDKSFVGTSPACWLRLEEPTGADDRSLRRVLVGHDGGVTSVAFSHDGQRAITGSYDTTARIWDRKSGKTIAILRGHKDTVKSVAFSPDGQRVLTGSDDETAKLWDHQSGRLLMTLSGHKERVNCVVFSDDGRQALTGSRDKTARIWDCQSGGQLTLLRTLSADIQCIAFSPRRQWIIAGGSRKTHIWDSKSGNLLMALNDEITNVTSIALSLDERRAVLGSLDETAWIWDCENKQILTQLIGHTGWINSVAFSPDGRWVLTGSDDRTVRIWDSSSGNLFMILASHAKRVNAVAFSPDGRWILSGSDDHTARIWECTSEMLQERSRTNSSRVEIVRGDADNMITQTKHSAFRGNKAFQQTNCAVFSAHGHYVLIGNSYDSNAQIWDGKSRKLISILDGYIGGIASVAFSPDEQRVFIGTCDRTACIWDWRNRELLTTWACDNVVTSAAFSPDGKWILTNSGEQAIIWDCKRGERLTVLDEHPRDVRCVAFSPDGRSVLTGAADKTAYIWDSGTGKTIKALEGHTSSVIGAVFSPDGQQILTSSYDKKIRLWDSESGQLCDTFTVDGVIHTLTFSPDGSIIAACDRHGHMMLLKADNPKRGNLLGLYIAPRELIAMHWLDSEHVMLVDTGDTCDWPHFYRLGLVGIIVRE